MPRHHLRPLGILAALALALLVAAPASGAAPCRVRNVRTGVVKASLQKAVRLAVKGDRLTVRGTCHGITTIGKSLTIAGIRTAATGKPTLGGDDRGTVVTVRARVSVTLRNLTITDGTSADAWAGGILNRGTLALRDVVVRGNVAGWNGGGIANMPGATLRLYGATLITRNSASDIGGNGGGLLNMGTAEMFDSSAVTRNTTHYGGGVENNGSAGAALLVMHDRSSISGNTATYSGGGVENRSGVLRMLDTSSISGNTMSMYGGGVYTRDGTLVMRGSSSITGNTTEEFGGGLYSGDSVLRGVRCAPDAQDPNVHDNTDELGAPSDCYLEE